MDGGPQQEDWHRVASVGDVADGHAIPAKPVGPQLGLYNVDGEWFCIDNVCWHAYALLSDG